MRKHYILPLLLILQIILVEILSQFPEQVERYYSNGLYPVVATMSRSLFGWIPFSVGDILYGILIILLLRKLWRHRRKWKANWRILLLNILSFISVFYFLFNVLWGLNYHRVPLHEKLGMKKDYEEAELTAFTNSLIAQTNSLHLQLTADANKKLATPYAKEEIFDKVAVGLRQLSDVGVPYYTVMSTKQSLISTPLTYMGFAGYLNPFTGEAQVNYKLPMYTFPTTVCHEISHQLGYASESEANFIGYLASIRNNDPYIRYSGSAFALRYCLSSMEKKRKGSSLPYKNKINPGILLDFRESKEFWDRHSSIVEDGFELFYDNFLKMNRQKDGMEGYSKFVGLMVNYHKTAARN